MWPWKSFIHLFIYSRTQKICIQCSEVPGTEQAQEHVQAWGQVWESPWLDAGDVGQGHLLQEGRGAGLGS